MARYKCITLAAYKVVIILYLTTSSILKLCIARMALLVSTSNMGNQQVIIFFPSIKCV